MISNSSFCPTLLRTVHNEGPCYTVREDESCWWAAQRFLTAQGGGVTALGSRGNWAHNTHLNALGEDFPQVTSPQRPSPHYSGLMGSEGPGGHHEKAEEVNPPELGAGQASASAVMSPGQASRSPRRAQNPCLGNGVDDKKNYLSEVGFRTQRVCHLFKAAHHTPGAPEREPDPPLHPCISH